MSCVTHCVIEVKYSMFKIIRTLKNRHEVCHILTNGLA